MIDLILGPLGYDIFVRSLLAVVMVGVACAVIGTYVVLKGLAFNGDAISHAAFPGVVIAYLRGGSYLIGAGIAAVSTALATRYITRRGHLRSDTSIGVLFAGSRQNFPARLVGVAPDADLAVLRVTIAGGVPRVAGLVRERDAVERGDPVAMLGYPLGFDLPMDRVGAATVAAPTLTVGSVSKVLGAILQLDGYGAPGSSGSPVLDREGRVIGVVFGGQRESQGKIVYAVPAHVVARYLATLGLRLP